MAKTDQLDAPGRPTAAFVVVGRVAAKRHSLSAGARRGIEVKSYSLLRTYQTVIVSP